MKQVIFNYYSIYCCSSIWLCCPYRVNHFNKGLSMNREYRKQKIQKRMSRIMVANAVAEANKQTTEEFFSGKPLLRR